MNYDYKQTPLSQAVFAGLFVGILATLINLAYNYAFRGITNFSLSTIVNVSSLIFGSVLLPVVAGVIFYFINLITKKGSSVIFTLLFGVLTVIVIVKALSIQRSPNPQESIEFRWLFAGVMLTIGGLTTFLVPYLYRKNYF
jgi:hypothetical protein